MIKTFAPMFISLFLVFPQVVSGQDNYEIQVYGSETVAPGVTMIESHSNYTIKGSEATSDGLFPTQNAFHETIEITHGLNGWSELGFYFFTSARTGYGWQWVGDHIRPRVRAPENWGWPVGVSLSAEIGYQERSFSTDTWTVEIRPIIDWEGRGFYFSVNPSFDLTIHGMNQDQGLEFSPNIKISYELSPLINAGIEYYGSLGPVSSFAPPRDQEHQVFPTLDLNFSPDWEFNCGVGFGLTPATDHTIVKIILGKRFGAPS